MLKIYRTHQLFRQSCWFKITDEDFQFDMQISILAFSHNAKSQEIVHDRVRFKNVDNR